MDSGLKSSLKKYFKNYSMLVLDIDVLYSKYRNLNGSLYTSPNGVFLNISGTIPFMFSGFTYKAPLLIKIPSDYPFTAPMMFIVPSRTIKIVKNHPNVDKDGNITLDYLDKWDHTNKLVHAVDSLQKSFNNMSPIYSSEISPKTLLVEQRVLPDEVTEQTIPPDLFSKYKLSDRDRNLVEHAYRNILTHLKKSHSNLIKQYNYDLNKYEVHRKILNNWVFALLDLNNVRLKLDEIEAKFENELKSDEFDKIEELYNEVENFLQTLISSKQVLSSLDEEKFQVEDIVKFKDHESKKLGELIAREASCNDMLEFLHETNKKGQISTRYYVQEMRKLSNEMFISKLNRENMLN